MSAPLTDTIRERLGLAYTAEASTEHGDAWINFLVHAVTTPDKLAQLMTGLGRPMTATAIVRDLVETYLEQMEINIGYAEAALRGDTVAQEKLFNAMLALHQAQIDVARAVNDAEGRDREMGIGVRDEPS